MGKVSGGGGRQEGQSELWGVSLLLWQGGDHCPSGGECGVAPHPAELQQRSTLHLHSVGDKLPGPSGHRRLSPGCVLEESQRAGDS